MHPSFALRPALRSRLGLVVRAAAAWGAFETMAACEGGPDPYKSYRDGEGSLGPVDPVLFPAASLGSGGNRMAPGRGTFVEIVATAGAGAATVGYFAYPFPSRPVADPLRLLNDGTPTTKAPLSATQGPLYAPTVYSFADCEAPPNYQFDIKSGAEFSLAEQGAIFTELPEATYAAGAASTTNYLPVVAEIPRAGRRPCQSIKAGKSAQKLEKDNVRSGKFFAWAIIDPANGVYGREAPEASTEPGKEVSGLGLQKWGWFNRFLLAYLDGGEVPQAPGVDMTTMKPIVRMKTQKLYYPRSQVMTGAMKMEAGKIGGGYDVLEAKRGEPAYSPVCEVSTYDAGMAPVAPDALPKTTAAVEALPMANLMPATPRYIFCLQVR